MWFKKIFSCILVASLINGSVINAMPGGNVLSLEEREQIGANKIKVLQDKIVEITNARKKNEVPIEEAHTMAEMYGPFMEKFVISQKTAQTLLSIDEFGDVIKENKDGKSIVKRLSNIFFKTDGRHFDAEQPMISPAMENAAYWFYHIMFGQGATPTSLITLNNVIIRRPPEDVAPNLSELSSLYKYARSKRKGLSYFQEEALKKNISADLITQFIGLFKPKFENFIAQASWGVDGEGLDDFIKTLENNPPRFKELSHKSLSIQFLTSFLLNLSDAKGDNFRVSNEGEVIGIDNDRFLAPDIFRQCPHHDHDYNSCDQAFHRAGVRSVFYAWKNVWLMHLDQDVREMLSATNLWIAISKWLSRLRTYDLECIKLMENGTLDKEFFKLLPIEKTDSGTQNFIKAGLVTHAPTFPLHLYKNSIAEIISKFMKLNDLLHTPKVINHKTIIEKIQPHVHHFYDTALYREGNDNFYAVVGMIIGEKYYSYENLDLVNLLSMSVIKDLSAPRKAISLREAIVEFNENRSKHISILQLVEKGLPIEIFEMITTSEDIGKVDENNQNLVHKAVLSSVIDIRNAQNLLELLKKKGANLDLKAKGRNETAGTPLTQAMMLPDPYCIVMFDKLIELGAGAETNEYVAEGFVNKYEHHLNHSSVFQEHWVELLGREPKIHWKLSLNKLLPVLSHLNDQGTTIKCSDQRDRFLSRELEASIVDPQGNLANHTIYGRRSVSLIQTRDKMYGLYLKSYPELPGVEEQVGRLTRNLIGFGAPYTELVRYKDTPVLLSQAIKGENLQDVLSKKPDILNQLDLKSLSGMIILSILTNPEDGKPDNYIVEPLPGIKDQYRLVCVDNDHAFVPAVAKEQKTGWLRTHDVIQVRSVLYCLDQMHEKVHSEIRDLFIKLDPPEVLNKWLTELKNVHDSYEILFTRNEVKRFFDEKDCFLCVPFKENMISELYQKFLRLRDELEINENITHLDLLLKLEPLLGKRYIQVLNKKVSVKARFEEVDGVFYSKAINGAHLSVINSKQVLKSMEIPNKKTIVDDLRTQGNKYGVIQARNKLKEIDDQRKEKDLYKFAVNVGGMEAFKNLKLPQVLEKVLELTDFSKLTRNVEQAVIDFLKQQKVENLRNLYLNGSKLISNGDLTQQTLGIGNITLLDIRGCINLTPNIFYQISQECPGIRKLLAAGVGGNNNLVREVANIGLGVFDSTEITYPHLERLNISDLPGLVIIKMNAPKLTILEVNNCPRFNFMKAKELNAPNLEKLEIKNNLLIKEEEIVDLLINRSNIQYYSLEGCTNISNPNKYTGQKLLYIIICNALGIKEGDKKVTLQNKDLKLIQVRAISSLANFTTLDLRSSIGYEGARVLSTLTNFTNLTTLDLSSNAIGDEGAKALSTFTNLTTLNLWHNQIGEEGAKALSTLTNLTSLDLHYNQIGEEGAKALSMLTNLTSLDLRSNQIGKEGAKALSTLTNLTSLDLRSNQIREEGAKALSTLTNLIYLDLSSNQTKDEGTKALSTLTNLTTLNLYNNKIGDEGTKALSALANLTSINLINNQIGDEMKKKLKEIFKGRVSF